MEYFYDGGFGYNDDDYDTDSEAEVKVWNPSDVKPIQDPVISPEPTYLPYTPPPQEPPEPIATNIQDIQETVKPDEKSEPVDKNEQDTKNAQKPKKVSLPYMQNTDFYIKRRRSKKSAMARLPNISDSRIFTTKGCIRCGVQAHGFSESRKESRNSSKPKETKLPSIEDRGCIHLQKYAELELQGLQRVKDWIENSYFERENLQDYASLPQNINVTYKKGEAGDWGKDELLLGSQWPAFVDEESKELYCDLPKSEIHKSQTRTRKKGSIDSKKWGAETSNLESSINIVHNSNNVKTDDDKKTKLTDGVKLKTVIFPGENSLQGHNLGVSRNMFSPRPRRVETERSKARFGDSMLHGKSFSSKDNLTPRA